MCTKSDQCRSIEHLVHIFNMIRSLPPFMFLCLQCRGEGWGNICTTVIRLLAGNWIRRSPRTGPASCINVRLRLFSLPSYPRSVDELALVKVVFRGEMVETFQ